MIITAENVIWIFYIFIFLQIIKILYHIYHTMKVKKNNLKSLRKALQLKKYLKSLFVANKLIHRILNLCINNSIKN